MTNRKHHVKDKQITTLSGWFYSPLRVGERAIISGVNGFSILTSPILTILEVSSDSIVSSNVFLSNSDHSLPNLLWYEFPT